MSSKMPPFEHSIHAFKYLRPISAIGVFPPSQDRVSPGRVLGQQPQRRAIGTRFRQGDFTFSLQESGTLTDLFVPIHEDRTEFS